MKLHKCNIFCNIQSVTVYSLYGVVFIQTFIRLTLHEKSLNVLAQLPLT
jgi:hypothetical protein